MSQHDETTTQQRESIAETAGQRGGDDRRRPVNPADGPAPSSPESDQEAIRKGEEKLDRA